jgi:predicted nicotinamide N-methyase
MSPDLRMDPALFIRSNTEIVVPPLVPEIHLHLATEVTPLWQATEDSLAQGAVPPPYWAFAWAGGQALARYLLDHPEIVWGAAAGGVHPPPPGAAPASVTAADIDPFAAAAIAANAALNGVAIDVVTTDLSVGDTRIWKVVTAGDVCYERPMAERAMRWLRFLAGRGSTVLLGDPGRAYVPGGGLCELARYEVPTSRELEGRERCDCFVWRVLPR